MSLHKERIVVKVGTSTLTNELGNSDLRTMDKLSCVLSDLHNLGNEVILVSSGAIAVGRSKAGLAEKPKDMALKQACAAIGQCSMIFLYDKFFGEYNKTVAQILLNAEDIEEESRKENLTNTFNALLELGVIPIVNENDSVSYKEILTDERLFGDNDMLSAVVSILTGSDRLIILSDIDGVYDCDPRFHPNAKLIKQIDEITDETFKIAGGSGTQRGTGGMRTKLQAAQLATAQGIDVNIINGQHPEYIYDIIQGLGAGTCFTGKRGK